MLYMIAMIVKNFRLTFSKHTPIMCIMAKRLPPPPGTKLVQMNISEQVMRRFRAATAVRGSNMTKVATELFGKYADDAGIPDKPPAKRHTSPPRPRGSPVTRGR